MTEGFQFSRVSGCAGVLKRISTALHSTKERGLSAIGPWVASRADYVNSNSGTHVLNVGGNYNNDTKAGVAYANANNDSTNTNNNIGARLDCASEMFDILRPVQSVLSMRGYDLATRQKMTSNENHPARNRGKLICIISASERRNEVIKPMSGGILA